MYSTFDEAQSQWPSAHWLSRSRSLGIRRLLPSWLLSRGAGKGDCRRTLVMSDLVFEGAKHSVS